MIKGQKIPASNIPAIQKLDAKAYSTEMVAHLALFHHADIHPKFSDAETVVSVGALVLGATEKATPVDADMLPIMDTADSNKIRKLSWANIKATLVTYFDGVYASKPGSDDNYVTDAEKALLAEISARISEGYSIMFVKD